MSETIEISNCSFSIHQILKVWQIKGLEIGIRKVKLQDRYKFLWSLTFLSVIYPFSKRVTSPPPSISQFESITLPSQK